MANYNRDLSHIKSLKDLQSEILKIKSDVATHEVYLKNGAKRIPAEARRYAISNVSKSIPSAFMKVVPFFLTGGAIRSSFGFVKNAAGLFSVFKKQKGSTVKDRVLNVVRKAGTAAAMKGLMNYIKNRKHSHQKIEVL
ncbi:MAG: hypothetical protein M3R72_04490 [Bacteroidota bacterium]|nr:hypothetical protein [Bacteroidota bacterium]